ncbi:MAG: Gfo/Idh/MocA family oxidoreductase [Victivallales bacterium]|jgi:predicted dehydrogenase
MSKKIKCGIIGCGVIAPSHAEGYASIDDVEILWACDLVREKAEKLASKYKIPKVCTDYREVLADPELDCISICTDHASHAPIAIEAFRRNKHVLCEKALSSSKQGLDSMFEAHRKHGDLVFAPVFQNRFNKIYQLIKKLVSENAFGTILTIDLQFHCLRTDGYYDSDEWRGTWSKEGGSLLINQAIHFIDLLNWTGGGIKAVFGTYSNLTHSNHIETEDTAVASLRFKNGALGTISATSSSKLEWDQTLSINGTKGSLDIRNDKILRISLDDATLADSFQAEMKKIENEKAENIVGKSYYGPNHGSQIADFIGSVRSGKELFVSPSSARETVEVVLGIYQSHREKKWIKIG